MFLNPRTDELTIIAPSVPCEISATSYKENRDGTVVAFDQQTGKVKRATPQLLGAQDVSAISELHPVIYKDLSWSRVIERALENEMLDLSRQQGVKIEYDRWRAEENGRPAEPLEFPRAFDVQASLRFFKEIWLLLVAGYITGKIVWNEVIPRIVGHGQRKNREKKIPDAADTESKDERPKRRKRRRSRIRQHFSRECQI